jgi:hypothetical protein
MLKRVAWKPGEILSIGLRDDLFSLAQMRQNHLMQFFDVRSDTGNWRDIDLGRVQPLFCIYVASSRLKELFAAIIVDASVKPNLRPTPRLMLSADPVLDQKYKCTVDLVELGDSYDSVDAEIVEANLVPSSHGAELQQYELTGMWGSPEKLAMRLTRYFDTGVNWDDSKTFIFGSDLPPPLPKR